MLVVWAVVLILTWLESPLAQELGTLLTNHLTRILFSSLVPYTSHRLPIYLKHDLDPKIDTAQLM